MNCFNKSLCTSLFLLSGALLSGCQSGYLSTHETVVPLPTFNQYASSPVYFNSVSIDNSMLSIQKSDVTSKLRQGFSSYYNARFQDDPSYRNNLDVTVKKQYVTKTYLQVGSNNDVLSAWKSFDKYVFSSEILVSFKCDNLKRDSQKSMVISRQVKVPASYSLYEKDVYLLGTLEKYIDNIDQEIMPYINEQLASCG